MNPNQSGFYPQGLGMNPQMQNYSIPEPNHSPQTPTPVNGQFPRNQPPPSNHSPSFGYHGQTPCPPQCPHMQQSQMGPGQMGHGQPGYPMMGQGQQGMPHPPMGNQGMGPPPMGNQGMGHPPMSHSFSQGHSPHGQDFCHPQVAFSQEDKQHQLRMDQHNYQAMQQQQEVNPRQVHPGTSDDIRGKPIYTLNQQGPQNPHASFHLPGPHDVDPNFYYYSLSYDIPQSHALNQAIGLERFRQPVSEWDMARRHQQQAQGEYRGKPRKAEQGREVKDDTENDRTKESLKESERRGNNRDMDRERERESYRNRNRNDRYRDERDDDRGHHTTTSEDEHDRDHRRINPRNFDTRYPDNVGPFIPYHPYPPGVHVPSPSRHLGPLNISPIPLTTPPNTPLNALMHPPMIPYHGHMPHVPMPGPFDSPFNYDFMVPVYSPYQGAYDDRRPRDKRRRRGARRTPSSSPEHMKEEKKENDKNEQS